MNNYPIKTGSDTWELKKTLNNQEKTQNETYTIQDGDNLWNITNTLFDGKLQNEDLNKKIEELAEYNNIEDIAKIEIGQEINFDCFDDENIDYEKAIEKLESQRQYKTTHQATTEHKIQEANKQKTQEATDNHYPKFEFTPKPDTPNMVQPEIPEEQPILMPQEPAPEPIDIEEPKIIEENPPIYTFEEITIKQEPISGTPGPEWHQEEDGKLYKTQEDGTKIEYGEYLKQK